MEEQSIPEVPELEPELEIMFNQEVIEVIESQRAAEHVNSQKSAYASIQNRLLEHPNN